MHLFNRSITVNVQTDDHKLARVSGVFLDSHHELCLNLTVDLENATVTTATAELRRTPHPDCGEVEKQVQQLVGFKLTHGVRKKIQAAVGQEAGCTHLSDLTMECVKGFVQARFGIMDQTMPEAELNAYVEDYLKGSCHHFRLDSDIYACQAEKEQKSTV